jgi:hypothetical protein
MVKINYHVVNSVETYNVLKEICDGLRIQAEAIVSPSLRFERLQPGHVLGLNALIRENPVEGILEVNSLDFALYLLGAREVKATDLYTYAIGKGKEKRYFVEERNLGNRTWKEGKSDNLLKDFRDGLFAIGPTAYFDYSLDVLSLQHRLKMYIKAKVENPSVGPLLVTFRCLPHNYAGVLDRHATRSDTDQHSMNNEFSLDMLLDAGYTKPDGTLKDKLGKILETVGVNFVARCTGKGWKPGGTQKATTREQLQFLDSCEGGLSGVKDSIMTVEKLQFGDDGKKRWWIQSPTVSPAMIVVLGMLDSSQESPSSAIPDALLEALLQANEMAETPFSKLFNELRAWKKQQRRLVDRYTFHALIKAWNDTKNGTVSDHYYPSKAEENRIADGKLALARMPGMDAYVDEESDE